MGDSKAPRNRTEPAAQSTKKERQPEPAQKKSSDPPTQTGPVSAGISGVGRQTLPPLRQQATGDVMHGGVGRQELPRFSAAALGAVTPPRADSIDEEAGSVELKGKAEVSVEAETILSRGRMGLFLDSEDRIRISDEHTAKAELVSNKIGISRERLTELLETLESVRGFDERPRSGDNKQEIQLDHESLELIKTVVKSAIVLHHSPRFSKSIVDIVEILLEYLKDFINMLNRLSSSIESVEKLIKRCTKAYLALKELCDILKSVIG